ncbi:MAG: M50 family metallopeptidase [Acidimicrobiales bacterium]|jgi:Zn-dependent protease
MRRSLTIARVAGVPIRLHWSFSLLVLLVAIQPGGTTVAGAEYYAIFFGLLFGSVTLHELSHSIVAMRLGLKVRDIVLLPIGGVSEIEGMGTSPQVEFRVAIAGPLASVVLGVVFLGLALATHSSIWPPTFSGHSWLERIGWLNLALAGFNMLPALPMDGGRVFRALLARSGNNVRATRTAAIVAGVFGVGMIGYGLENNFFLVLIGGFVLMGAASEWQSARFRDALHGLQVGAVMHPDPTTVPTSARAVEVAAWLAHFPGRAVPVVDELGRYTGIVDYSDVAGAPPDMAVGSASDRQAPVLAPQMELFPTSLESFQSSRRKQLAVVADGRVVGVLYLPAVNMALMQARDSATSAGWSR